MARYGLVWLEIAREYLASLPVEVREQVSARIEQLLENPRQPRDGYDELTDQWTTTYGGGAGLNRVRHRARARARDHSAAGAVGGRQSSVRVAIGLGSADSGIELRWTR